MSLGSGDVKEQQDINMKKYRIVSFVHAKNILEAAKNIKKAEVVDIELQDEIDTPANGDKKLGF